MSTKINVRSPFFLSLTEPTQTLGIFACTTGGFNNVGAGLSNFSVDSSGTINNPNITNGAIIDQTVYGFAVNDGTSVIPRSVTYTIAIPPNYTNSADATIDCVQSFDQPFQTAQENPSLNDTCPSFNGDASNPSNVNNVPNFSLIAINTPQVIDVDSFFTAGADEAIGSYTVERVSGSVGVSAVISGTGSSVICTIQSQTPCINSTFYLRALNASGSCNARSNSFTFDTTGCVAYNCNDTGRDITTGRIDQDGTVHKSIYSDSASLHKLLYGSQDITTSLNVGPNLGSGDRTVILTYRFNIPPNYTNSPNNTLDCLIEYEQPATQSLPTFGCGDANITAPFISDQGSIQNPTDKVGLGTYVTHLPAGFQTVTTDTPRTITFTVQPPATGFTNSGGSNITCAVDAIQPGLAPVVGTTDIYLSQAYQNTTDICLQQRSGIYPFTNTAATSTAANASLAINEIGHRIFVGTTPLRGGDRWYAISRFPGEIDGDDSYRLVQVTNDGIVQARNEGRCNFGGDGGDLN